MSSGKESPPLFGDDADSDREDMFSTAAEKPANNNEKPAIVPATEAQKISELVNSDPLLERAGGSDPLEVKGRATPPLDDDDIFCSASPSRDDLATTKIPPPPEEKPDKPVISAKPSAPHSDDQTGSSSTHHSFTPSSDIGAARAKESGDSEGRGFVSGRIRSDKLDSYDLDEDDGTTIEILVSDPKKIGDGMNSYVVYRVTTRTNSKVFRSCEFTVVRRFSDFLGLHEKLQESYQPKGKVVPLPPEKSVMGTTKVKMTKEETAAQDFVEKRRASLERFLNRVAKHPELRNDTNFIEFLEHDGDLPKATNTSALSGAGIARLFNKFGDSLNKITFTMSEPDQWFEDKIEEIDTFDRHLKELCMSLELLVTDRKELSGSTGLVARSMANLGSQEEDHSLCKALSSLAEVQLKVEQHENDQTDSDFFVFCELIKDYINLVQSIREVLHERVKAYKVWQDIEAALTKKKEHKVKMEQQRKFDRNIDQDISDCEDRCAKFKQQFEVISASVKQEIIRFDRQKTKDFKSTLLNYLQCMMNNQQQMATLWESYLPEAKLIQSPTN